MDNTNLNSASWTDYTSANLTVNLGSIEGWHQVWLGLKGCAPDATVTWQWTRLKLDKSPPIVVVTNPVIVSGTAATVDVPIIQLQGYCPEKLCSINYDLVNSGGTVQNQQVLIIGQDYDTNAFEFTTNSFQAFDVDVLPGQNTITIHATDMAGNVTTTNFTVTVDYSNKTAPVAQMIWPQDGMEVSGANVTLRGQVDDPTVTVTATVADSNGNTSTIGGMVERNGRFWVENVPLNAGNNNVSITLENVMNQSSTINLTLSQSPLALTISPVDDDSQLWNPTVTIGGSVSDSTYAVWVNGVPAIVTPDSGDSGGTWTANDVPTTTGWRGPVQRHRLPSRRIAGRARRGAGDGRRRLRKSSNCQRGQ